MDRNTWDNGKRVEGSFFNTGDNTLHLYKDIAIDKFTDTFFHESFHATEITMWGTDDSGDHIYEKSPFAITESRVYDAIVNDVKDRIKATAQMCAGELTDFEPLSESELEQIVNAFVNHDPEMVTADNKRVIHPSVANNPRLSMIYEDVRAKIEKDINMSNDKPDITDIPININVDMTGDIYGAITYNKIKGIIETEDEITTYGHGIDHWQNGEKMPVGEAWAEYNAAYMLNDEMHIAHNSELFPSATKALDALVFLSA